MTGYLPAYIRSASPLVRSFLFSLIVRRETLWCSVSIATRARTERSVLDDDNSRFVSKAALRASYREISHSKNRDETPIICRRR